MRASFHKLSPDQRAWFGNGVCPFGMFGTLRNLITQGASWFFQDASWQHHDFGYFVGGDRWDRARCDWKFLVAMVRDALSQQNGLSAPFKIPAALVLSLLFYMAHVLIWLARQEKKAGIVRCDGCPGKDLYRREWRRASHTSSRLTTIA